MSAVSYTLSDQAKREFIATLQWSKLHFGSEAAVRYKELLKAAFVEVAKDPSVIGSYEINGLKLYHTKYCRHLAPVNGFIVKKPRHFLLYRENNGNIEILRILHDQMNIEALMGL